MHRSPSRPARRRLRDGARRGAAAGGGRDGALPDRPGVADQRRQARTRARSVSISLTRRNGAVDGRDRGRRRRASTRAACARRRSVSSGCASGSRLLDGRLEIESSERRGHDARRRGAVCVSIRVLIVDDHAVVRAGLRLLLDAEDDLEPVGEAGNAREAVFEARTTEAGRDPARRDDARAERARGRCRSSCTSIRRRRCWCSRCRTTRSTCARRSRPARAATC